MDCSLCLKKGGPVTLATQRADVYCKGWPHYIEPNATEAEFARYHPRCSLELLKTAAVRNTVICLELNSSIHVTLSTFDSLALISILSEVAKVIPYCSLVPDIIQALDRYFSQFYGPHYLRYLLRAIWVPAKAMIRIYSRESSLSSDRPHNHRMGAASGPAVCKDSS